MHMTDTSNTVFNLAADLVNHTSRHVFITGKAGTGKTTFLKHIKQHTQKNTVVVAPTGVAAINAGGVTMHSFFQLPFGPFIPVSTNQFSETSQATDKHSLFKNIRFAASRREIYQELELLIIDEVSMVRCDMLDAVDIVLRHFRRQPHLPFGGVQVIYIGDMFQLPPVVGREEWSILKQYYESPFFFGARVLKDAPPLYVELKKIYRQNEQHFIDILNRIRNNQPLPTDLDELNKRFNPDFENFAFEKYVTLTTHNSKADIINEEGLKKLPGKLYNFTAEISGEFADKSFPTESNLKLKTGAQVMFIKNDSGNERKYYNGKLAIVKSIVNGEIVVAFHDGEDDLKLEKETWKNIRYNYDKEKDNIEEEELGNFKQFPIRLAWAITIHKSQGLTFDNVVIDAGSSFAAGQVYVALSRCTSLDGVVLQSQISRHAISTDKRIIEFAQLEAKDDYLDQLLQKEKEKFQAEVLLKSFNLDKILSALQEWKELIPGKKLQFIETAIELNKELIVSCTKQTVVIGKFRDQLISLVSSGNDEMLEERVNKAIQYFGGFLEKQILLPIQQHVLELQYSSKVKKYVSSIQTLIPIIETQINKLNGLKFKGLSFSTYVLANLPENVQYSKKEKPGKGQTFRDSLFLFRQGKSIGEIAKIRNLAPGTIESHLSKFVYTGEIHVDEIVPPEIKNRILEVIENVDTTAAAIKQKLADNTGFGHIHSVVNYYKRVQEQKSPVTDPHNTWP